MASTSSASCVSRTSGSSTRAGGAWHIRSSRACRSIQGSLVLRGSALRPSAPAASASLSTSSRSPRSGESAASGDLSAKAVEQVAVTISSCNCDSDTRRHDAVNRSMFVALGRGRLAAVQPSARRARNGSLRGCFRRSPRSGLQSQSTHAPSATLASQTLDLDGDGLVRTDGLQDRANPFLQPAAGVGRACAVIVEWQLLDAPDGLHRRVGARRRREQECVCEDSCHETAAALFGIPRRSWSPAPRLCAESTLLPARRLTQRFCHDQS